ncbi:MAG: hypothetical protein IKO41_01290 [Lachnospiraceae bacterium]|nr:hypothetical protein [Lachnospiraceae bacterium]
MSAPKWFDYQHYLEDKLAKTTGYDSMLDLEAAFLNAGYSIDADGLYAHFQKWGNRENISPDSYFNADYYFQSKAADYYGKDIEKVTNTEVQSMKDAFAKAHLSAWDHYTKYGMKEGIDPNANFNTTEYLNDKLAQLQAEDPSWTYDSMLAAFKKAGVNPVSHYLNYGQSEGLTVTAATHGATVQELTNDYYHPDHLVGTMGDPTVDGHGNISIDQNYDDYFTGEAGTLQSDDTIDGLGGYDELYVRLNGESAVEPTITNVETLLFRVQNSSSIDADRITLEDGKDLTLGSDNSRGDLVIEDVRHNSNETVVRFADSDPIASHEVDYRVFFNPQNLKADTATESGILKLMLEDVRNADQYNQPLAKQPFNAFTFNYTPSDGGATQAVKLVFPAADKADYTGKTATYNSLLKAFQDALAVYEADHPSMAGKFSIALGDSFPATAKVGSDTYTSDMGKLILIDSNSGTLDGTSPGTGWGVTDGTVPSLGGLVWGVKTDQDATCPLIETTVQLDNVGRVQWDDANPDCLPDDIIYGANAGDLEIGSMADRGGIERMDVYVDRGSWLSGLYSTNNTLRMVTVNGDDINGDGVASNGPLYIGDWNGKVVAGDTGDNGNQNINNMTWTDPAQLLDAGQTAGLHDVAVFDASTYTGDINIGAEITDASYDKYFKSVDGTRYIDKMFAPTGGYEGQFSYLTGSGDDVVNMTVDGDIASDVDFDMMIKTVSGDDLVAFKYEKMTANQSANQKAMQNVAISTGGGEDDVWFYGDEGGSVKINAGSGDDVVYANQHTLDFSTTIAANYYNAVWVYNSNDQRIAVAGNEGATLMNDSASKASSFAMKTNGHADTLWAKVEFKGFTASAKLTDSDGDAIHYVKGGSVDATVVNHAVINAIENDSTLSTLLSAKDSAGSSLIIESLINGDMTTATDQPQITFFYKNSDNKALSGNAFSTAYTGDFAVDSTTAQYTGFDNTTTSQVVVNGGNDNDVIVLGQNGSKDVVELKDSFGNDKLVDFTTGEDVLNVKGLLSSVSLSSDVAVTSLGKNKIAFGDDLNSKASNGIYSQSRVEDLVDAGKIKFTSGDSGNHALLLLEDDNKAGQHVYTAVLATKDSDTSPEVQVLGSVTLAEGEDVAFADLTTGSGLV